RSRSNRPVPIQVLPAPNRRRCLEGGAPAPPVSPTPKGIPMAPSRRKSAAIALAVVGVAGLSLASAAQLNVDSSALGAANEVVAACQDAEIQIGFANQYDATLAGYETAAVTLSGVLATCAGQSIQVTLASE